MNHKQVVEKLKNKYPDKNIIVLPPDNPTEILCELEATRDHPDYSIAIAVIDRSATHVHHHTTEVYEVLEGTLKLYKDGKEFVLNPGDTMTINSGEVHYATGDETWIRATSNPGWTIEDHMLV